MMTDPTTSEPPTTRCQLGGGPSAKAGASAPVSTIAPAVAKPLRMLLAYFITTATRSPPRPLTTTTPHVLASKPRSGSAKSASPGCLWRTASSTFIGTVHAQRWTLRSHSDALRGLSAIRPSPPSGHGARRGAASFRMRSKKTEANDDEKAAISTAAIPSATFRGGAIGGGGGGGGGTGASASASRRCASAAAAAAAVDVAAAAVAAAAAARDDSSLSWTRTMPAISSSCDAHCHRESERPSMRTESSAVSSVLIW